jgi:hypothetical protein
MTGESTPLQRSVAEPSRSSEPDRMDDRLGSNPQLKQNTPPKNESPHKAPLEQHTENDVEISGGEAFKES